MASSIEIDGRRLDLADDVMVVNFQVFDLGQIESNQVEYTNQVIMPKTPNNVDILQNSHLPNAMLANPGLGIPYTLNESNVIIDGYLNLPQACFRVIETSSSFKVSLQSGGATFYVNASSVKLNDPNNFDWSYLDFSVRSIDGLFPSKPSDTIVFAMLGNDRIYKDSLVSPAADPPTPTVTNLIVNNMFPMLQHSEIIKQIEGFLGYTFQGLNTEGNMCLTLPEMGFGIYGDVLKAANVLNQKFYGNIGGPEKFNMPDNYSPSQDGTWEVNRFKVGTAGYYNVRFQTILFSFGSGGSPASDPLQITMPDGSTATSDVAGYQFNLIAYVYRNAGEYIYVDGENISTGDLYLDTSDTYIAIAREENSIYTITDKMPDWTILDYLKEVATMYGYLVIVDDIQRSVDFVPLSEVNKDRGLALDLSKRALIREPIHSYQASGYGQISSFKFAGDYPMKGHLMHAQQWAEGSVDVWSGKSTGIIQALNLVHIGDKPYAFVHAMLGAQTNMTYHLLDTNAGSIGTWSSDTTADLVWVTKRSWVEIIRTYYPEMKNMLLNWLQVDIVLYLSAKDISTFSYTRPVYWDSQYWYINKISNYKIGTPSTVTLIRLQQKDEFFANAKVTSIKFSFSPGMGKSGEWISDEVIELTQKSSATGEQFDVWVNDVPVILPISLTIGDVIYLFRTSNTDAIGTGTLS